MRKFVHVWRDGVLIEVVPVKNIVEGFEVMRARARELSGAVKLNCFDWRLDHH